VKTPTKDIPDFPFNTCSNHILPDMLNGTSLAGKAWGPSQVN
jgi:hypothetical protein